MRIGLLIYGDMNTLSGGYLYNRKLVAYLERQGDTVKILSLPHGSWHKHLADNFSAEVLHKLANADIDILVQDELAHPSLFLLNKKLRRQVSWPVISLVHLLAAFDKHPFYSAWCRRLVERLYLQSVSGLILNSRTTLAQTRQLLRDNVPDHCIAVPCGDNFGDTSIDPAMAHRQMQAPGPLRILFAGNVIQRKGLHVLIRALALLPAGDYRVTVAGRTDMEPAYVRHIETLIRQYNLQNVVKIRGPVAPDALALLYQEHHVMALPSAFEGYGIVYVEALQFGLPVIGTTGGAAGEIITHGDNGYLIRPGDSRALAGHLQNLHDDRTLLQHLGENARATYAAHPTWDTSCSVIRQFLQQQIDRHGAAR